MHIHILVKYIGTMFSIFIKHLLNFFLKIKILLSTSYYQNIFYLVSTTYSTILKCTSNIWFTITKKLAYWYMYWNFNTFHLIETQNKNGIILLLQW